MVERLHRQLKASLRASPHPEHWTEMLHIVLLGIRTTLKEQLSSCMARLSDSLENFSFLKTPTLQILPATLPG